MSFKNELDRRSFLKSMMFGSGALLSTSLDIYFSNVILHFLQKAHAHAAGDTQSLADKKLIHLCMAGAAPRWYWDLPLKPNGNDDMGRENKMLITKFTHQAGAVTGGTYATTQVGNFHMPYMWSGLIPTPQGSAPMSQLAQNMLTIRGIDLLADGHDMNRIKQINPGSGSSMLGLAAESATTPIPAISTAAGNFYKSTKGLGVVTSGSGLSNFLTPFINGNSLKLITDKDLDDSIDRALGVMSSSAKGKHKYIPNTYEQRQNAKNLFKRDFSKLQEVNDALVAKYALLISRSFGDSALALDGVDSVPLQILKDNLHSFEVGERAYTTGNLQDTMDSKTSITALANSMAVAEYMSTEGFSSSINILSGNISGVLMPESKARVTLSIDCHRQGAYSNLFVQTKFFRAQSACLNELITALKSVPTSQGSLFDQTAIAVTSDFNRSPNQNGSGSDHGWEGSNYTIFSGMVPELTVIGNTMEKTNNNTYTGKWIAGPVDEISGRKAGIGNAVSSLSLMLNVRSPLPNDASFVYLNGNKVYSSLKRPKNV